MEYFDQQPERVNAFCLRPGLPDTECFDALVDSEGEVLPGEWAEDAEELVIYVEEDSDASRGAVRRLYMDGCRWAGGRLHIRTEDRSGLGQWALDGMRVNGGPPVWHASPLRLKEL